MTKVVIHKSEVVYDKARIPHNGAKCKAKLDGIFTRTSFHWTHATCVDCRRIYARERKAMRNASMSRHDLTSRAEELLSNLCAAHGIKRPDLQYTTNFQKVGSYSRHKRLIKLSLRIDRSDACVLGALRHEFAHALAYTWASTSGKWIKAHGEEFKRAARKVNCPPSMYCANDSEVDSDGCLTRDATARYNS